MTEEKTEKLPFADKAEEKEEKPEEKKPEGEKKFEKPPHLRRIISASCTMSARDFIGLMRKHKATLVLDTRVGRRYKGIGFYTSEDDVRFVCELAGIEYIVVESLAPTHELRKALNDNFKDLRHSDRDPMAWTKFIAGYEDILRQRKPSRTEPLKGIIEGGHEVIAVVCACGHHDDCHRSYACGLMAKQLEIELEVVYPGDKPANRKSPRRYLLRDFPHANLTAEVPRGRK